MYLFNPRTAKVKCDITEIERKQPQSKQAKVNTSSQRWQFTYQRLLLLLVQLVERFWQLAGCLASVMFPELFQQGVRQLHEIKRIKSCLFSALVQV